MDKKKFIKRLKNFIEDIEKKDDYDYTACVFGVLGVAEDEIKYEKFLLNHGLNELDSHYNYLKEEECRDVSDICSKALEGAFVNGSLTFSTYRAERELSATYNRDEIKDYFEELGIDEPKYAETTHIMMVEKELNEELNGKLSELSEKYPEVDSDELGLLVAAMLLDEHGYEYKEQIQQELKKLGLENETEKKEVEVGIDRAIKKDNEIEIPKKTKGKEENER